MSEKRMLNRFWISRLLITMAGLTIGSSTLAATDYWQLNMPKGVTPISKDMYDLHMIGMFVCIFIGVVVFGVMLYSLFHHRKSRGAIPASFHDNTRLEIIWSVIPFLILIGLAIPATKV